MRSGSAALLDQIFAKLRKSNREIFGVAPESRCAKDLRMTRAYCAGGCEAASRHETTALPRIVFGCLKIEEMVATNRLYIGRTSTTSGTKCFSRFWMPCCSVAVDEGQPAQEPFMLR